MIINQKKYCADNYREYQKKTNYTQIKYLLFLGLIAFSIQLSKAQDSTGMSLRRNTIKLDLTSNLIYTNSISLSYERVVKQNQSLVVSAGV